jgi:beta-N-acetylglucosaminidase
VSFTTNDTNKKATNNVAEAKTVVKKTIERKIPIGNKRVTAVVKKLKKPEYYRVSTAALNIRIAPNQKSQVIGSFHRNDYVEVTEKHSGWYKTNKGFIYSKYITKCSSKPKVIASVTTPSRGMRFSLRTIHDPVNSYSYLSISEIRILIKGTGLKGLEYAISDAEHTYGVNAHFIIGAAKLESGGGTSHIARRYNNLFGMMNGNGGPVHFKSKQSCVYAFAK